MGKSGEVAHLCDNGGGNAGSHTFECLQSSHLLGPGRFCEKFANLLLEFSLARLVVAGSVEVSLEGYLLRGMGNLSVLAER